MRCQTEEMCFERHRTNGGDSIGATSKGGTVHAATIAKVTKLWCADRYSRDRVCTISSSDDSARVAGTTPAIQGVSQTCNKGDGQIRPATGLANIQEEEFASQSVLGHRNVALTAARALARGNVLIFIFCVHCRRMPLVLRCSTYATSNAHSRRKYPWINIVPLPQV